MVGNSRVNPNWAGVVSSMTETLDDLLDTLDMHRQLGTRPDIVALEALDELDRFLSMMKQDLGV